MSHGYGAGAGAAAGGDAVGDGRIRTACAAWVATVATGATLLPLVDDVGWLAEAGALLAVQAGTGVLARWRRLPEAVTVAAQAVVALMLLTMATVPGYAVAGLIPGPEALARLGELLSSGAGDIARYMVPAPVTDGIRLMLLGGMLVVGLLVDLLAVTLRSAAAAGLPLLALYSVVAAVSQSEASWFSFLCAASGYLVLLMAESRVRLARWGRYFAGHGPAGPAATAPVAVPAGGPRLRGGRRIGAVTLAIATTVPLLLPSLGDGLLGLNASGRGGGEWQDFTALDPVVALQEQLNRSENRTVLTYRTESTETSDMYLRLVALDEFDGEEWRSSDWHQDEAPSSPWPVTGLTSASSTMVTTTIQAEEGYTQTSLPVPYPAVNVTSDGSWLADWHYDRASQTLISVGESTVEGHRYQVQHLEVEPTKEELAAAPEASSDITEYYTRVPDDLSPTVRETALSVTEGATNDYERAVALQEWFTQDGGFRYDTSVESGTGSDAIVKFLQDREGFCVHFAFTMAAMARTLGIPAQVVVGFSPGEQQADGSYQVGVHNAHAWPELYFEGVGWVRFEPTPGQGSTPSYTQPDAGDPSSGSSQEARESQTPEEETESSATPTPSASSSTACDTSADRGCEEQEQQTPESDQDDAALTVSWPAVFGGGGALLVAALTAAPAVWRRRMRSRRLARGAGALAAWQELADTAWDFGITPRSSETPRQAADRIVRVTGLGARTAAAAHRVAEAVEHELYAPRAWRRGEDPAADVRAVDAGLRAAAGRWATLRARLLPRSAMRVMHALTARRASAARRLGVRPRRSV